MKKYDPYFEDPFYEDKIEEKEYHKHIGRLKAEKDFKEGKINTMPSHTGRYKWTNYYFEDNSFVKFWIPFLAIVYSLLFRQLWVFFVAIIWAFIFNWKEF
ncbi:hypothetical protein HYX08_01550 [Candidatus Woesearchaeota archaeon]|nr:hypothetical protein [Candidatus Woesearchaeota archaeon]